MKTSKKNPVIITLVSGAALAAAVLFSGVASAEQLETEAQIAPSVPFAKAMEVAASSAQGEIVALELDHYENRPVYVAEVESAASHTILRIDGNTGEVLATAAVSGKNRGEMHAMLEEMDHNGHDDGDDHDGEFDHGGGDH